MRRTKRMRFGSIAGALGTSLHVAPFQNARPSVVAAMHRRGAVPEVQGSTVVIEGDERLFDVVRDALATLGTPVRRLEPRRRSLEEVFLSAGLLGGQARTEEVRQ